MHGNAIQMLKCSDDCSCVSVRKEVCNAGHPRTMWSSINCSCGTRTVVNLTPYRNKMGRSQHMVFEVPLGDVSFIQLLCGVHFLLQTISFYECNFTTVYICTLRLSCLLHNSRHVKRVMVNEAVFSSRQGSTHAISDCVTYVCLGINAGTGIVGAVVVDPYFLHDKLTAPRYRSFFFFLEIVLLPGRLKI
jgi:hypothetical protein